MKREALIDRRTAANYAGVSMPTMYRWLTKGIRDPYGNRIRVKRKRRGGRIFTTHEWVDEFFTELDLADKACCEQSGDGQPRPETNQEMTDRRKREIKHAESRCNRHRTQGNLIPSGVGKSNTPNPQSYGDYLMNERVHELNSDSQLQGETS